MAKHFLLMPQADAVAVCADEMMNLKFSGTFQRRDDGSTVACAMRLAMHSAYNGACD